MPTSWIERAKQFKSPCNVIAGFLLRSRETQKHKAESRLLEIRELQDRSEQRQRDVQQQLARQQDIIARLDAENQRLRQRPLTLPDDPPLAHHEFGPRMIALCVNLANRVGLRATPEVLQLVLEAFGIQAKLPNWTTVRTWLLRVGVAAIERPVEKADDWVLLADHSNQIGEEKVLSVLGVRASQLPPPGQPLKLEDMRVLQLIPGTSWKREDMKASYEQVAKRTGAPLAVIVDGAVELREGAEMAEMPRDDGKTTLVLGDFKHFAANVLKRVVGNDARFAEFQTQLGRARSAIQQTELAHFTPPSPKPKARFMNLQPTLEWAKMVSWQLSQPRSQARRDVAAARMNEKLGWLRAYRSDIARWDACQAVVSAACTFINEQGLSVGTARRLADDLRSQGLVAVKGAGTEARRTVTARLLRFLRSSASRLSAGQRLPLSTEVLESSFGLFKRLERQHHKGGFTSLLAAYGSLLRPSTPASIREDFALVSVQSARDWISRTLGSTLTSRRHVAYREARHAT